MARRIAGEPLQTIEDSDGISWETPEEYLFIGILKGCGCGRSDELARDVATIFLAIAKDENAHTLIYENSYHELIAHWLHAAELTEHGTGIGGSWLTERGKAVYAELLSLYTKQGKMEVANGPPH